MDYFTKYMKYKNKFLNLRKQIEEFNYINEDRKIEDFDDPINKNKYMALQEQSGGSASAQSKKVLILCHPRPVTGTFVPLTLENHWWGLDIQGVKIFNELLSSYNLTGQPIFETIDTLSGGTYQDDAFSDSFINRHINDYDLVLVPDCGGPWYHLQDSTRKTQEEENDNKSILITLSLQLTNIVKPNGIIVFSKFINESPCNIDGMPFESLANALNYFLQQNGFTSEIKNIHGLGATIIAKRN